MTQWLSDKIRFMSFLMMVMIVILHANLMRYTTGISHDIQVLITEGITRVAVPAFFFISGFLLMYKFKGNPKSFFISKIISRIKSLFIPFVIWSLIGLGLVYVIETMDIIPYNLTNRHEFTLKSILTEIFVYPTICFQLWFIRDLFLLVLLSPAIYCIIYIMRYDWLIIGLLLSTLTYSIGILSYDGIYFFGAGMYVSLYHKEWMNLRWNNHKIILAATATLFIILCVLTVDLELPRMLQIIRNATGAVSIWGFYDLGRFDFSSNMAKILLSLSFFIYLFHLPLSGVIQKILINQLPLTSNSLYNCTYILCITLTLCISVLVGMYAKLKLPSLYKILTGGR